MADYVNGRLFLTFFGVFFVGFFAILSILFSKFSDFHKKSPFSPENPKSAIFPGRQLAFQAPPFCAPPLYTIVLNAVYVQSDPKRTFFPESAVTSNRTHRGSYPYYNQRPYKSACWEEHHLRNHNIDSWTQTSCSHVSDETKKEIQILLTKKAKLSHDLQHQYGSGTWENHRKSLSECETQLDKIFSNLTIMFTSKHNGCYINEYHMYPQASQNYTHTMKQYPLMRIFCNASFDDISWYASILYAFSYDDHTPRHLEVNDFVLVKSFENLVEKIAHLNQLNHSMVADFILPRNVAKAVEITNQFKKIAPVYELRRNLPAYLEPTQNSLTNYSAFKNVGPKLPQYGDFRQIF